VRLAADCMESVLDACLLAEENNYAQLDALLKVTELLEVAEDKAIREGLVLAKVARKAMRHADYQFALQCCKRIMRLSGTFNSWDLFLSLASCAQLTFLSERLALLAHVLKTCPPNYLIIVLEVSVSPRHQHSDALAHLFYNIDRSIKSWNYCD
jgi:hypothetical protein